jgi:hypothetical protein
MGPSSVASMRTIDTTAGAALAMLAQEGGLLVSAALVVFKPIQLLLQMHQLKRDAAATLYLAANVSTLPPSTVCGQLIICGTPTYVPNPGASIEPVRHPAVSRDPADGHLALTELLLPKVYEAVGATCTV